MVAPPARRPQRRQYSLLEKLGVAVIVLSSPLLLYVAYWVLVFESDVPFISKGTFYALFVALIVYLVLA